MSKEITLVTGANSGLGLQIAKYLNERSKFVVAGCRRKETFEIFDNMDYVQPVLLDITKNEQIESVMNWLKEQDYIVKGLVNNAGIANSPSILYYETPEEMKKVFDVNVFGMHAITKACLPDLIKVQGRITNISSVSGIVTTYGMGTYSMTKHAVEAYTDALSYELKKFNIQVSVIEPGNYRSNIGKGNYEKLFKLLLLENNPYEKEIEIIKKHHDQHDENVDPMGVDVAEATYHALFDANPKIRYTVYPASQKPLRKVFFTKALAELLQCNEYIYPYSLDELTDLLKEVYEDDLKEKHFILLPDWAQKED